MPFPAGASDRTVGAVNHFFPASAQDPILANTYMKGRQEIPKWYKNLWHRITIDGAYKVFTGFYPPGLPRPMQRGEGVIDEGFGEFSLTIYPQTYNTARVPLHHNDVRDSNAPVALETVAQHAVRWLAKLELLFFEELVLGSAATYLHPETSFTNMFGGSGLYSTSHSFNGQTLNNLLTKSGVSISATLEDFWALVLQRRQMVDANGIPETLGQDEAFTTLTMVYPPEREKTIAAIGKSELVLQDGASAPSSNFTRNVFMGKWDPHCWEMLADDANLYAFFINEGDEARPFIMGEKEAQRTQEWTETNSDWSRATQMTATRALRDFGVAPGQPKCTLKID